MGRGDMRDMDIERVLREHFKAEASELRAPRDPWAWVESRLEPTPRPRLLGRLMGMRRIPSYVVSGALAAAVVSAVAIVAAVGVWSVFVGSQYQSDVQGAPPFTRRGAPHSKGSWPPRPSRCLRPNRPKSPSLSASEYDVSGL